MVSVGAIYKQIWQDKKQGGSLYTHLRHNGKRYRKRGTAKDHKRALLTINDRQTGLVWIRKLKGKEAKSLAIETVNALLPFKDMIHTITADNGKEFALHERIAKELKVDVYFAHPYHSWERGANENTNGLIRQFFPKGADFESLSEDRIQIVQDNLNNRPRKRLGFYTPIEISMQVTIQKLHQ